MRRAIPIALSLLFVLVLAAWGPFFVGGGSSGTPVVTSFTVGPCVGTTNTSPSADGVCLDFDAQALYPNNFVVDSNGDQWKFKPHRGTDLASSSVMKNGVVVGGNSDGRTLTICSSGQVCLDHRGQWIDGSGVSFTDGPLFSAPYPNGSGSQWSIVANNVSAQALNVGTFSTQNAGTLSITLNTLPTKGTLYDSATPITSIG